MKTILSDSADNEIICNESGRFIHVTLHLKGEKRDRALGVIDTGNKMFTVKRDRKKHLHIKSNSYGFNYDLLANAKRFDKVRIMDEYGQYIVPRETILKEGDFLYFKKEGFEKQIFLSLDKIVPFLSKAIF